MISFMADVIGIRDDMYIGKGDAYMAEVSESVQQAYEDGVLDHRPRSFPCSPTPTTPRSPLPTCSTSSTSLAA